MLDLVIRMLERGGLHFVAASFVFIAVFFLFTWLMKKFPEVMLYVFSGLAIVAVMANHEIYDLGTGSDPMSKAFTDVLSWLLGCMVAAYGVYRLRRLNR